MHGAIGQRCVSRGYSAPLGIKSTWNGDTTERKQTIVIAVFRDCAVGASSGSGKELCLALCHFSSYQLAYLVLSYGDRTVGNPYGALRPKNANHTPFALHCPALKNSDHRFRDHETELCLPSDDDIGNHRNAKPVPPGKLSIKHTLNQTRNLLSLLYRPPFHINLYRRSFVPSHKPHKLFL
jgi:hypothetical protein